ncbi:hypothetical protein LCGC14_1397670 [marine sediment metagenome]|uniref:TFIIS-type domain-containing protein n=1 Tax=marine sediment metagenome TaxID=412755 RepID=A0A0F9JY84_9ZZZZ
MVDFCPECSNLLRKKMKDSRYYLICKCGYERRLDKLNETEISKIIKKKSEALKNNLIIVSNKEKILIHPETSKICHKCGYKRAVYWQEQLFSADEPMVSFFRCLNCNIVWREY